MSLEMGENNNKEGSGQTLLKYLFFYKYLFDVLFYHTLRLHVYFLHCNMNALLKPWLKMKNYVDEGLMNING